MAKEDRTEQLLLVIQCLDDTECTKGHGCWLGLRYNKISAIRAKVVCICKTLYTETYSRSLGSNPDISQK
jgi:hypothetical protein